MRKLLAVLGLLISFNSFSATCDDAKRIYAELTTINFWVKKVPMVCDPSTEVNAWTNGSVVVINQGLLDAVGSNYSAVALVLGHELGHLTDLNAWDPWSGEYNADKWGMVYSSLAGYNACEGAKLLLMFNSNRAHPPGFSRYTALGCSLDVELAKARAEAGAHKSGTPRDII